MKKFIILVSLMVLTVALVAKPKLTPNEVCENRGHITVTFHIYRNNVKPQFRDLADSTVVFYYPNNKQTGVVLWCKRCEQFVDINFDPPKIETIWRKNGEKRANYNIDSLYNPSNSTGESR